MNTIKILILLGVIFILVSCENNSVDTADGNTDIKTFIILDADNSNKTISTYEYSAGSKKLVSASFYNDDEEFEKKINYEYDGSGVTGKSVTNADGETESTLFISSRSQKGRISRKLSNGTSMNIEYTYDDSGRITSMTAVSTEDGVTTVEEKLYE